MNEGFPKECADDFFSRSAAAQSSSPWLHRLSARQDGAERMETLDSGSELSEVTTDRNRGVQPIISCRSSTAYRDDNYFEIKEQDSPTEGEDGSNELNMGCHAGPGNNSTGSQESILRGFPLAKGATIKTTEIRTYLT